MIMKRVIKDIQAATPPPITITQLWNELSNESILAYVTSKGTGLERVHAIFNQSL